MFKKIAVFIVALAMVISFTACYGDDDNGSLSAEEIIDKSVQVMRDVVSYRADMDMVMDIAVVDESGEYNLTMTAAINGTFDIENQKMMMDMIMEMSMLGMSFNITGESYLINDMMYNMNGDEESGYMWTKSEMPEGYWEEVNQMDTQVDMLEVVYVEITGSEMIEGVECYILKLNPDIEQLWQLVMQQSSLTGEEMLPEIDIELYQDIFKDFHMRQWVAKDTYYIARAEMGILMEATAEEMGYTEEEGSMTADITIDILAYDYNQPVTIVLPAEAEDAELVDIY